MTRRKRILSILVSSIMVFIMMSVVNTGNSVYAEGTTYYVSTGGNDTTGTGSQSKPWKTISFACTQVDANKAHTIKILAGTYTESKVINVPEGVNLIGEGSAKTIIKSSVPLSSKGIGDTATFLIQLRSIGKMVNNNLTGVDGNQTLSGFMLDGQSKTANGGMLIYCRNNVKINGIEIKDFFYLGAWLSYTNNFEISYCKFSNNTYGSDGGCQANLTIGSNENGSIHDITIDETMGTGYGINSGNIDFVKPKYKNFKIYNNEIKVPMKGAWNNFAAAAICIEHWGTFSQGVEIYNNYLNNNISMVPQTAVKGVQTTRVHHNLMVPQIYAIECGSEYLEIDHNFIDGGNYPFASWHESKMTDITVHHNVINKLPTQVIRFLGGCDNLKVYNNTFYCKFGYTALITMFGGQSNNIDVKNNLFINTGNSKTSPVLELAENATAPGFTVMNNLFLKYSVGKVPGTIKDNITVNAIEDIKLNLTGDISFNYFAPKAGSPVIDTGLDVGLPYLGKAPDIGAVEYGEKLSIIGTYKNTPIPERTPTPTPKPKVVLNDTFDKAALKSTPSGWSLVKTGGTITVEGVPSAGDKSIKLNKTKTTALSASKSFTAQSGIVNVEAKLRADNVTSSKSYFSIWDSRGKSLLRISIESSKVKAYDGKSVYSLVNAKTKSWYSVKTVINTSKDTCSIYVNGKLYKSNIKLITPTNNVSKVKYEIPGSFKGIGYLNNVKITKIA